MVVAPAGRARRVSLSGRAPLTPLEPNRMSGESALEARLAAQWLLSLCRLQQYAYMLVCMQARSAAKALDATGAKATPGTGALGEGVAAAATGRRAASRLGAAPRRSTPGFVSRIPTPQGPPRVSADSSGEGWPASRLPSPGHCSLEGCGDADAAATPVQLGAADLSAPALAAADVEVGAPFLCGLMCMQSQACGELPPLDLLCSLSVHAAQSMRWCSAKRLHDLCVVNAGVRGRHSGLRRAERARKEPAHARGGRAAAADAPGHASARATGAAHLPCMGWQAIAGLAARSPGRAS